MKTKKHLLICAILITNVMVFAQQSLQKKANNLFNKFSFVKASQVYEELIAKDFNTAYATRQLGNCYAYMRNTEMSSLYYKEAVAQDNVPLEYFYKYAQSLRGQKDYKGYREWMKKFKDAGGVLVDNNLSKDANFITSVFNTKQNYFLNDVKFNSELSDFGAIEHNNQIYFTSTANSGILTKHVYGWNEKPFLDIYAIDKETDTIIHHKSRLKGNVNSTYHDGPLTISKDGKTMFFSRNNYSKNTLGKDKNGYSNLKIYKATLVDNKWSNIEELPFNNDNYSTGHPALNKDSSKLYFASDMPGSIGGSDIYYVDINTNGSYGTPINVGNIINTNKNELFPFVNSENVLFFSSDGHLGLGLLDIYGTVSNKENDIISILNLGVPVNSNKDDFSFFMNEDGLSGYISSNRDGGKGDDDIYSYDRIPQLIVEGSVINPETNKPLKEAVITLLDKDNNIIAFVESDENGHYEINIDRDTYYTLSIKKEDYEDKIVSISSKVIDEKIKSITADIAIDLVIEEIIPINELYPIYFDYNKYEISNDSTKELDKIVNLMQETYPDMLIKIESYSDSRGHEEYNKKLSIARANSTYKYLISKGISPTRITEYNGYGEENLTNKCDDSIRCTEEEHKLNRRTLFLVIKMK